MYLLLKNNVAFTNVAMHLCANEMQIRHTTSDHRSYPGVRTACCISLHRRQPEVVVNPALLYMELRTSISRDP